MVTPGAEVLFADRCFASGHDGCAQPLGELFRKLIGLVTSIDVDGLARRVDHDLAVMARAEVFFDFRKQLGVDDLSVEVVG